jgi:hypothetical protein
MKLPHATQIDKTCSPIEKKNRARTAQRERRMTNKRHRKEININFIKNLQEEFTGVVCTSEVGADRAFKNNPIEAECHACISGLLHTFRSQLCVSCPLPFLQQIPLRSAVPHQVYHYVIICCALRLTARGCDPHLMARRTCGFKLR